MSQYSLAQWSLLTRVPQKQNQGVGRTVFLPEAPEAGRLCWTSMGTVLCPFPLLEPTLMPWFVAPA